MLVLEQELFSSEANRVVAGGQETNEPLATRRQTELRIAILEELEEARRQTPRSTARIAADSLRKRPTDRHAEFRLLAARYDAPHSRPVAPGSPNETRPRLGIADGARDS